MFEDFEEEEVLLLYVRDKRRYIIEDRRDLVLMKVRVKKRVIFEDEEVWYLKKRRDIFEFEFDFEDDEWYLFYVRKKRRDNLKEEVERGFLEVRVKRWYIFEDEEEW